MKDFENEVLSRLGKLEAEINKIQKEDPGHEFARMCNDGRVKKKIWWASKEFQIEEVYQEDLKKYENSWFSRLFFKPPIRADGSTIKYNDMKSDDFYGWSK